MEFLAIETSFPPHVHGLLTFKTKVRVLRWPNTVLIVAFQFLRFNFSLQPLILWSQKNFDS